MTAIQTEVTCPKCGGRMWDNRLSKKNPKQPDFKCRSQSCDGVIWPPRNGTAQPAAPAAAPQAHSFGAPIPDLDGPALTHAALVVESLNDLLGTYTICFNHSLRLAKQAGPEVVLTLEGLSAMTATLLITAKEKGLA